MILLLHPLETLFSWLLTASWQASVLALLVLVTQRLLRSRLNPRWRYALWLLVLLRLILPALPESAFSLFQFAPPTPPAFANSVTQPLFVPASTPPLPAVSAAEITSPVHPFSTFTLLALLWLTGAIVLLILTLEANRRFARHVANSPTVTDPEILQSFADARAELHIRRSIRLIENSQIASPAIMGLFRSTLLLPAHVRDKFDPRELRLIFLHELAHLQRGDLLIQALIALLQILHWFNPVLWYAFRRIRIDREPATDALVLSRAGEAEKDRYGLMLIKLLEHFNQRHSLPTLVGILEDQDQFKRRFTLIAQFTRRAYAWSLLGVLLIAIFAITCLTKSKATEAPNGPKPGARSNAIGNESQILAAVQKGDAANTAASKKNSDVLIRLNLKVVQINDDDYQAHRAEIDAAVLQGDAQPLLRLKSNHPVMELPILTRSGEQSVIESVRVLPYPVALGKDSNGKIAPTEYKKRNLGVRFISVATFADGKVNVAGHLEVTRLSGWIPLGNNYQEPSFNEILKAISDLFIPGQTRGYAASAGALIAYPDPSFYFAPDKPPDPSLNSQAARRIFFFLSTQAFQTDGRPMTKQSNAEIRTSANRALPVDLAGAVTLRQAIDWDRADFAKNLLDSGTMPTQSDFTFALTATRPKIVKLFWDHGTHGCSPLSFAISQGASAADVEAMLNAGAKVEPDEETDLSPLTIACSFGNTPAASVLLAHGANPNSIGQSRELLSSPLYMAIGRRQPEIAQLLLDHGAIPRGAEVDVALIDLSAEMKARAPAAFYQKAAACFRLLVAHGALEKVPPQLKPSLLWNACLQVQDPDIVKTLLAHGFRPTDSDGFGNTALSRVRDAVEGKNNWPASPQFQPLLDLLEAAAHPGHTGVPTPAIAPGLTLTTRTFLVPAGFFKATTADYDNVQAELIAHGVTFPADAAAIYLPGPHKIVVRNTAEQLDKIQALLTPPPDPASAQVQLNLKVLEIPDTVYAANQTKIDNAVDHADIGQFNNLQGVSLLSTPSVTTKVGLRANIDIVREFPYATAYEPGKYLPNSTLPTQGGGTTNVTLVIPPTPSQFTSKDVGISAELTPSIEDRTSRDPGKIVLAGRVTVADFVGFTKSNPVDSATPSFNTSESQFLEALDDHQLKGIWIPGQHAANNGDPARYLLFVTANVVK